MQHLLNVVDPIHWIVYFLPSRWKFWKKQKKQRERWRVRQQEREGLKAVTVLEDVYRAISGKASGDLLPRHCVCLSVSLQGRSDSTPSQAVWLPLPSPHTADISHTSDRNRARPPWAEMDGWMAGWIDERGREKGVMRGSESWKGKHRGRDRWR